MKRGFLLGVLIGVIGVLAIIVAFTGLTSAQGTRRVELRQGWNQLVWTGESRDADTALAIIAPGMPIAYGWQSDSQAFSRYVPGRPEISTMIQLERDKAYWILMSHDFGFNVPSGDVECPTPTACPSWTPYPEYSPCPTSTPCPTPTACPTNTPCLTGRCPPGPVDNNKCADALYEWAQSYYLSPIAEMDIELWCGEWPEMYVKCSSMPISRDKCAQALFDWAQSGFLSPIAEMDVDMWC